MYSGTWNGLLPGRIIVPEAMLRCCCPWWWWWWWVVLLAAALQLLLLVVLVEGDAQAQPQIGLPNCSTSVPYPFGIEPGCYLLGFNLTCNTSRTRPGLFLLRVQVVDISPTFKIAG
jgi:hypothetical protein